jgi:3-hydroxyisobutyrate dehydrogenase-like beta-hydroxyacid dehydrogenase
MNDAMQTGTSNSGSTPPAKLQIAVVGLGNMGRAIAERLRTHGFALRVWNRTKSRAEGLGIPMSSSPAEAVGGADIVLTSLADDAAVRSVVFDGGLLKALDERSVHIGASTISHELGAELVRAHADNGRRYLASPVVGRPDAAAAGKLFVLVGGEEALRRRCQPVFDAIGQRTLTFADAPSANLAKLLMNLMLSGTFALVGEIMALGEKGGIPPSRVVELLTSTLFGCPAVENYGNRIAKREFEPAGFRMPLGLKDVELALAAGKELRVALPSAGVVRDQFITALAHGHEQLDWSALTLASRLMAAL